MPKQFFKYLQGLTSTRRFALVSLGFAVQLQTFLTLKQVTSRHTFNSGAVPSLLSELSDLCVSTVLSCQTSANLDDEIDDLERHYLNNNSHMSPIKNIFFFTCVLRSWYELGEWQDSLPIF